MGFDGLVVPTITQFSDDGAMDPERNARYARDLTIAGVNHLFLLGSLGESSSVDEAERPPLFKAVFDGLNGRVDAWVGCGSPATHQAVRLAVQAEKAGAAALVAVPPYYLHPTSESIATYYRSIHAEVKIPLLAYNVPSLVGYALDPSIVHQLAVEGTLQGITDAAGTLESLTAFLHGRPPGFAVLPGDDALASSALAAGSSGAVMGTANEVPRLAVKLVTAGIEGRAEDAARTQWTIDALVGVLREAPFPSIHKFLAHRLRNAEVGYRPPYGPLTDAEAQLVLAALQPIEGELRRQG
ncbi:MAG: dihydrodipicolinate synthase family protein [Thermoplasmata archaeon]|nr:dihydrodipicolinate synthase family protein [Thermoplasmata archaeon]